MVFVKSTSRIQFRRASATFWSSTNPILRNGEPGFETNTGRLKIGDGITNWNTLSYQDTAVVDDISDTITRVDNLEEDVDTINATLPGIVPAGVISQFAGSTAPSGYLLCTGQELDITTYSALYAVLGTTYGSLTNGSGGAGTTHFRVPNLQGKIPVAKGSGSFSTLGSTGGTETVQIGANNLPAHSHPNSLSSNVVASSGHRHYDIYSLGLNSGSVMGIAPDNGSADIWGSTDYGGYIQAGHGYGMGNQTVTYEVHRSTTSEPTGSTTVAISNANNVTENEVMTNLQPYIVVNYIIKT